MLVASFVFIVVYVSVAALGPRVWLFTRSPMARLIGIVGVQIFGICAGCFAAWLVVPARTPNDLGVVRGYVGVSAAKVLLLPILTVALSLLAAIVHWSKHARDNDASAHAREGMLGAIVVEVSSDRLRAELRRRDESEARARQITILRSELAELCLEQETLVRRTPPPGDPTHWPTQALREEVNRQARIEEIRRRIATLDAELSRLVNAREETLRGKSEAVISQRRAERAVDEAERQRRLASIQEWIRKQQS